MDLVNLMSVPLRRRGQPIGQPLYSLVRTIQTELVGRSPDLQGQQNPRPPVGPTGNTDQFPVNGEHDLESKAVDLAAIKRQGAKGPTQRRSGKRRQAMPE